MGAVPLEDRSDERLVAMSAAGDREAFTVLVRRHQDVVYSLALRLTGDPDAAGDATQEALIRAWRAIGSFRGDAAITTWLHRITVNTVWTHRRKVRRRQTDSIDTVAHLLEAPDTAHPVRKAESAELGDRIDVALHSLPSGRRAVVVMKDVYGWSHADIAESLGISVAATKVRLHRARLQLQDMLEEVK